MFLVKDKIKVGHKVTLEKDDLDVINDLFKEVNALKYTIMELSQEMKDKEQQAWDYIHEKFPELKLHQLNFHYETGVITVTKIAKE